MVGFFLWVFHLSTQLSSPVGPFFTWFIGHHKGTCRFVASVSAYFPAVAVCKPVDSGTKPGGPCTLLAFSLGNGIVGGEEGLAVLPQPHSQIIMEARFRPNSAADTC